MLKKLFQKVFYNPYKFVNKNKLLIRMGNSKLSKSFNVRFSGNTDKCLVIGDESILENSIVFERNGGHINIGNNTFIGSGTKLISVNKISIGNNVQISWNVTIYDHNGYSLNFEDRKKEFYKIFNNYGSKNMLSEFDWFKVKTAPIVVEDDSWIGFGAVILKGVTVGRGAIVAAHSVVTQDVESFTVVMGNPAKVIKRLNND